MTDGAAPSFGTLLKRHRAAVGLTQEELAERAHLSVHGVSALERGVNRWPHGDTVALLAEALALDEEQRAAFTTAARPPARRAPPPTEAPPSPPRPSNLPFALTSFIGREQELATVRQLIGETRLLTLTGAGGCGKTRLALQLAGALPAEHPDGVWLVELASLTSSELVPEAVASALDVPRESGHPLLATLIDFLRPKRLVLLLDNCEHLVGACAELAAVLLQACGELRILATSREALEVPGETTYLVPSLAVPDPWLLLSPEELLRYAAARLFMERARARRHDFALSDQNAAAVVRICHRLDGIPLAIELAAARVDSLPVEGIAARLDDCFQLLSGGPRIALPRQRTLRATLDWSYGLLSAPEQTLLSGLSAFAGGWTLEAAEVVGAGDGVEAREVLDLLAGLVRKSLVLLEDRHGGARYRLLDTVRQYGQERLLAGGTAKAVQQRFRDWCLALATQAETGFEGPEQLIWLNRIEAELDNLRSLLAQGARDTDATEAALRLATALRWFWPLAAHSVEGRRWLEMLLAAGSAAAADVRATAIYAAGRLADLMGDRDQAYALYARCLPLFREVGDTTRLAYALHYRCAT